MGGRLRQGQLAEGEASAWAGRMEGLREVCVKGPKVVGDIGMVGKAVRGADGVQMSGVTRYGGQRLRGSKVGYGLGVGEE